MIETPITSGPAATVTIRFSEDPQQYDLQQLSSGLKDILVLLAAVHFSKRDSLLIIEEPENHLHPSAQKALAKVFDDVASRDDKQIILTTHSDLIVAQFAPEKVVFLSRDATSSRATPLPEVDVYTLWRELGVERNLLLQALGRTQQVIVLVEGRDDFEVLEPLWADAKIHDRVLVARALGGGWQDIIDHGAGLEAALKRFRLPSRVFMLLDNDRERDAKLEYLSERGFDEANSHVWEEEEIESYLVLPTALQRLSTRNQADVDAVIATTSGRGKARLASIFGGLGLSTRTPFGLIIQQTLAHAPTEIGAELRDVVRRVSVLVA